MSPFLFRSAFFPPTATGGPSSNAAAFFCAEFLLGYSVAVCMAIEAQCEESWREGKELAQDRPRIMGEQLVAF